MMKSISKIVLLLTLMVLSGCKSELISNVTERQANEIVSRLQQNNIDAQKVKGEKGVFSVSVDPDYMSTAIELLNTYNLPSNDRVEIAQQFPADAMVSTPLGEKARLISAIEQRLGQSLLELANVTSSRVHLSYPTQGDDNEGENGNTASILVIYEDKVNEAEYIDKIKRLVKNSMNNINYENISVVLFKKSAPIKVSKAPTAKADWLYGVLGLLSAMVVILIGYLLFSFKGNLRVSRDKNLPNGKP
nr:type III secretion inner membrane ring lipoprotein SctJ [uncultured Enterobacter sp.]